MTGSGCSNELARCGDSPRRHIRLAPTSRGEAERVSTGRSGKRDNSEARALAGPFESICIIYEAGLGLAHALQLPGPLKRAPRLPCACLFGRLFSLRFETRYLKEHFFSSKCLLYNDITFRNYCYSNLE